MKTYHVATETRTDADLVITLAIVLPLALPLMVASVVAPARPPPPPPPLCGRCRCGDRVEPVASVELPVSGCIPDVPSAEGGTIRVPLDRSHPGGPSIPIGYALIRHQDDPEQRSARSCGTRAAPANRRSSRRRSTRHARTLAR